MKKEKWLIALAAGAGIAAIVYKLLSKDIPAGVRAVQPFDINRYLGTWNEIARLPNNIEKNIKHLTEEYSHDANGDFRVVTKGYSVTSNKWRKLSGKIKFAGAENIGMLKVSYFGPFYASYNVLDLDPAYKYAMVSGSGLDYLWILSKESEIPGDIKTQFLNTAASIGFNVDELEWM